MSSPWVERIDNLSGARPNNVGNVVESGPLVQILIQRFAVGGKLGCEDSAAPGATDEVESVFVTHWDGFSRHARRASSHHIDRSPRSHLTVLLACVSSSAETALATSWFRPMRLDVLELVRLGDTVSVFGRKRRRDASRFQIHCR